jgi:hypothetical protein
MKMKPLATRSWCRSASVVGSSRGSYEGRQVLEAARLAVRLAQVRLVAQQEADLDAPRQPGGHERVPERLVRHGRDHECLRVRAHGPPGQQDGQRGNQVPAGPPAPVAAEPHAEQARAPPHDAHGRVLQVVVHPGAAPAVLGEGVDAAPGGDDDAVEELLAAARAREPALAREHGDDQNQAVADEGGAHDEVREALAQVVAAAEALRSDAAEQHLRPGRDGEQLADGAVQAQGEPADAAVDAALPVELEVDAEEDLGCEQRVEDWGEGAVGVGRELAALVRVAEEVAEDGEAGRERLHRDVPSRSN